MSIGKYQSKSDLKRIAILNPAQVADDYAELAAENQQLKDAYLVDENGNEYVQVAFLKQTIRELKEEIESSDKLLIELKTALEFYANPETYVLVNDERKRLMCIFEDPGGKRAREALRVK